MSDNSTAKAALAVGAVVMTGALVLPRVTLHACRIAMIAVVSAAPLVAWALPEPQPLIERFPNLQSSMHHRLAIWHFAAERTAEKPLFGWGFNAARSIPGGEVTIGIYRPMPTGELASAPFYEQMMPLHPHNAALHVWMELGLVGAALLCVVLWLLVERCRAFPAAGLARPCTLATLAAGFVVANMSFGFWQSWWQSTLWIAAAGCVAVARGQEASA